MGEENSTGHAALTRSKPLGGDDIGGNADLTLHVTNVPEHAVWQQHARDVSSIPHAANISDSLIPGFAGHPSAQSVCAVWWEIRGGCCGQRWRLESCSVQRGTRNTSVSGSYTEKTRRGPKNSSCWWTSRSK